MDRCVVGQGTAKGKNRNQLWMATLGTTKKAQKFGVEGFGTTESWVGLGGSFPEMACFRELAQSSADRAPRAPVFPEPVWGQSVVLGVR